MFSARQIAEAAVEKEKIRKKFYEAVSRLSPDKNMSLLFDFLAQEEDIHVTAFSQIRDTLPADTQPDDYTEDMAAYMDSMIDDRLYSEIDSEEFIKRAVETREVFSLAIGFEKDAILYFREFLPFLSENDRELVVRMIDEEKGHIRKLAELKLQMG